MELKDAQGSLLSFLGLSLFLTAFPTPRDPGRLAHSLQPKRAFSISPCSCRPRLILEAHVLLCVWVSLLVETGFFAGLRLRPCILGPGSNTRGRKGMNNQRNGIVLKHKHPLALRWLPFGKASITAAFGKALFL